MANNMITIEATALTVPDKDDKDFDYVEQNIHTIIDQSTEDVSTLRKIADQSQEPRAYEVLHNFYKMMLDSNKELLLTKKTRAEIDAVKNPGRHLDQPGTVNNNLFVGSTADLQRFLMGKYEQPK